MTVISPFVPQGRCRYTTGLRVEWGVDMYMTNSLDSKDKGSKITYYIGEEELKIGFTTPFVHCETLNSKTSVSMVRSRLLSYRIYIYVRGRNVL